MTVRARTVSRSFALAAAIIVPLAGHGQDETAPSGHHGQSERRSDDPPETGRTGSITEQRGLGAATFVHPNPQSILDGLRVGFVNVSSGNLTFERRDIVVPGRQRVTFARIYDSRIGNNADFGPGWRLSLDEEIVVDDEGALYVDRVGASYRFRRAGDTHLVPDPMVPGHSGTRLEFSGQSATLVLGDGRIKLFERLHKEHARWSLRRIETRNGDWIAISHRDGRLETVFDGDGEILRVVRDANGRISSVADRHGRNVRYNYDGPRLAQVRDYGGNHWSHDYDASNRLVSALNVDGEAYLRVGYDETGRVAWSDAEAKFAFDYRPDRTFAKNRVTGERQVFERIPTGAVIGFSSTTGIAWRLSLDATGRVTKLGMSEGAARLIDDGPHAFRPDGMSIRDGELEGVWARVVRFSHSASGTTVTETMSAAGREQRNYEYDDEGRLKGMRSSTGGIPTLHIDYTDGTSLRTGWDQSDTVFQFRAARDGTLVLVGNGRMQIEIAHDRQGDVVAFHSGTRSVLFERNQLGRVVETRHVDGSITRYFLNSLGYRTLSEYGNGAWRRVAVDPAGTVVAFESADAHGRRHSITAHTGTGIRTVELSERQLDHYEQFRVLTGEQSRAVQPNYGVVSFNSDNFAPDLRDPLVVGVAGLDEALALAPVAAELLARPMGPLRAALESPAGPMFRPAEYGPSNRLALAGWPATALSVPEVRVVVPRPRVAGFYTHLCVDDGWVYETVADACAAMVSYTQPASGDTTCTPCPTGSGGGGGGGGGDEGEEDDKVQPTVTVESADVASDSIVITLAPTDASGMLSVSLLRDSAFGTSRHIVSSQIVDGGTHTATFNVQSVPTGAYTGVRASWTVGTDSPNHTKHYGFDILGDYRHSQYNTPNESACTGSPTESYVTNNQCAYTGTTFKSGFFSQVNLNGSGHSLNHGTITPEEWCLRHRPHPSDANGRSFRSGHTVKGSCGGVSDNTVAVKPGHQDLSCGDRVYIVGVGVKTVTDRCPGCTLTQLDNYTTTPNCSDVYDLGTYRTIKL